MSNSSNFWGAVSAIAFKNTKTQEVWPSLSFGQTIPPHLHSALKDTSQDSVVSFGILKAVAELLQGQVQVMDAPDQVVIAYPSSSAQGGLRAMRVLIQGDHLQFEGGVGRLGPFLLLLALAVLDRHPLLSEARGRWWTLIEHLSRVRGARRPGQVTFSKPDLRQSSNDQSASEALMALIDTVYYSLKRLHTEGLLDHLDTPVSAPSASLLPDTFTVLPSPPKVAPRASGGNALINQLLRVAKRGGRVLLIGPTGTGKTEAAKAAAVQLGRPIFQIKGSPNMEDTDFIGGYHLVDGQPLLVDGPFVQAFLCAQQQPAVLLFDELFRSDPLNLSTTIGILDHNSAEEAALMGIPGLPAGRYYVLRHRNNDLIWAPVKNLLLVATTNFGDGYQQATTVPDPAMLGRFNLQVDVPYMDSALALTIYVGACGDAKLAAAAHTVELETRQNHVSRSGLLARELNARVVVSWLEETLALMDEGESRTDAFRLAAASCVLPFCVERNEFGGLDEAAQQDLERTIDAVALTV